MAISILLLANAEPPSGAVDLRIEGMRSQKGVIRACLTRDPRFFPHCEKDPASQKFNLPAATGVLLHFRGVQPGDYAITVLHDENGNGKADMFLGVPREGVGFSNNPRLLTGPPDFASARFHVDDAPVGETIRLKYFLRTRNGRRLKQPRSS